MAESPLLVERRWVIDPPASVLGAPEWTLKGKLLTPTWAPDSFICIVA